MQAPGGRSAPALQRIPATLGRTRERHRLSAAAGFEQLRVGLRDFAAFGPPASEPSGGPGAPHAGHHHRWKYAADAGVRMHPLRRLCPAHSGSRCSCTARASAGLASRPARLHVGCAGGKHVSTADDPGRCNCTGPAGAGRSVSGAAAGGQRPFGAATRQSRVASPCRRTVGPGSGRVLARGDDVARVRTAPRTAAA